VIASHPAHRPRQVYGVDFSGAVDAGKKIWVTQGVIDEDALRILACYRGADLPGSGVGRDRCLAVLRDFIANKTEGVFGLDFPFGLSRELIQASTWEDFVLSFPDRYTNPEGFRQACWTAADGSELKRVTDRENGAPFSAYNLRLFRQTYYGIRDVLGPLVRDQLASVLPMQSPTPGRAWVLEICPASTLKRESLYLSYKGKGEEHTVARKRILDSVEQTAPLSLPDALRSVILEDTGGDVLDSLVAAFAVSRTLRNPVASPALEESVFELEGYIYV
jgi:hypothetical protein